MALGAEPLLTIADDGEPVALRVGVAISLDVEGVPLSEVVAQIVQQTGVGLVLLAGEEVRVTARLVDVPWDVALHSILAGAGLQMVRREGAWQIVPTP